MKLIKRNELHKTETMFSSFKKKYLFLWLSQVLVAACGIQFPDQGLNPSPLHWELGVLATGPPGKSQNGCLFKYLLTDRTHPWGLAFVPWHTGSVSLHTLLREKGRNMEYSPTVSYRRICWMDGEMMEWNWGESKERTWEVELDSYFRVDSCCVPGSQNSEATRT